MQRFVLDAEAGQVSAELERLGVDRRSRVHVVIEVVTDDMPMAAIAQAGRAFDWLEEEPDLYSDSDLQPH